MARRLCRICNKPLSTYNTQDICFCHQDDMIKVKHIPQTLCASFVPERNRLVKSGETLFQKVAFTKVYVGDGAVPAC